MTDRWDPTVYERFRDERALPFHELLDLVTPLSVPRAVDLGCGTGALTAELRDRIGGAELVGIDRSPAMLEAATARSGPGLRFVHGDLSTWTGDHDHGLVLANASLHWVPDHAEVLAAWTRGLAPGGQLAVQVPANADHPAHRLAGEVASQEPFASCFDGPPPPDVVAVNVHAPEWYAELLYELGFAEQFVALRVYLHVLPSTRAIVDWVRGTTLTRFAEVLPDDVYERFLAVYAERLVEELGERAPIAFPFKRILMWGRLPA